MVTPVIDLLELGRLVAKKQKLPRGIYEVVVQYKFGSSRLQEKDRKYTAMAVMFGGIGLRATKTANPMTIEVGRDAHRSPGKKKAKLPDIQ